MKEADANRILVRSLKHAGAWACKIPDAPIPPRRLWPTLAQYGYRPKPIKRPFDITAVYQGFGVAIETKLHNDGYEAFGARHLEPHQHENLQGVADAGGLAFVALVVYEPRQFCRLLLWEYSTFGKPGDKSIRKKDLEALPYHDRVRGQQRWDLADWLSAMRKRHEISRNA